MKYWNMKYFNTKGKIKEDKLKSLYFSKEFNYLREKAQYWGKKDIKVKGLENKILLWKTAAHRDFPR